MTDGGGRGRLSREKLQQSLEAVRSVLPPKGEPVMLTWEDICEKSGRSVATVYKCLKILRVTPARKTCAGVQCLSREKLVRLRADVVAGMSKAEVRKKYGISEGSYSALAPYTKKQRTKVGDQDPVALYEEFGLGGGAERLKTTPPTFRRILLQHGVDVTPGILPGRWKDAKGESQ